MKTHLFNYSLLATGIAAVLCINSTANAATSGSTTTAIDITNQASASYNVGELKQPTVYSNEVVIEVSEQVSFSLVSNNEDDSLGDDSNVNEEVAPNGFASFKHTLANTGNRTDSYTIKLENVTEDDKDYDLENSTATFTVYSGTTAGTTGTITFAQAHNQTFTLDKGQSVQFTINAKTTGNIGGNEQALLLSATSSILANNANTNADTKPTLTNTDRSITKLPTFSIVKTVTNALDLNDLNNDTAEYQIVVKNNKVSASYSTGAVDVAISDNLPTGLIIAKSLTTSDIQVEGDATTGSFDTANAGKAGSKGFNIKGVDIPVAGIVTITFTVKKDPNAALDPATAINHVSVTDDLDNSANTANTVIDSTDKNAEQNMAFYAVTEQNHTDGTKVNGTNGDDSTQSLLTIDRKLTLTNPTEREIPSTTNTTSQAVHETIITNNGQDSEGKAAGELTFKISDDDADNPDTVDVGTVTIAYDDGSGTLKEVVITANGEGIYDINNVLQDGIPPGKTATIKYTVISNEAPLFTSADSDTPTKENTVVKLILNGEGAPTVNPVTDTTTVKGLTLDKFQALDVNCDGIISGAGEIDFTKDPIEQAEPGQCVIYRIDAKNTSSAAPLGFDITDVVILDELAEFSANADYVDNSATTTFANGTATNNGTAITTTIATLAPQATETMQFKVKIKTAR
ncbi:hypothetical protein [Psychrobacter namhaensis]|uniref:hypothetical protein n=1 Tax=Psychrobacter namhaensis TaxID=292734 RepID=UPI003D01F8C0